MAFKPFGAVDNSKECLGQGKEKSRAKWADNSRFYSKRISIHR